MGRVRGMAVNRKTLSWFDFDQLIDKLIPQFDVEFDVLLIITRGGIVPGGALAEALDLNIILTASVDFPPITMEMNESERARLQAFPKFVQFPENELLLGQKILVVDDVWGSGRTITAVQDRVRSAGGVPFTCVLHFNPHRNLFGSSRPDYYADLTSTYIIYPWEVQRGPRYAILPGIP